MFPGLGSRRLRLCIRPGRQRFGRPYRATDIESQTRQAIEQCPGDSGGRQAWDSNDIVAVQFYLLDLEETACGRSRLPGGVRIAPSTASDFGHGSHADRYASRDYRRCAEKGRPLSADVSAVCLWRPIAAEAEQSAGEAQSRMICFSAWIIRPPVGQQAWCPDDDSLGESAGHAIVAVDGKDPGSMFCPVVASDPQGSIEDQTRSAFSKLSACLAAKGFSLSDITATNVYLNDMDDFAKMNAVYADLLSRFEANPDDSSAGENRTRRKSGADLRICC